jgi:hypothetical protein
MTLLFKIGIVTHLLNQNAGAKSTDIPPQNSLYFISFAPDD